MPGGPVAERVFADLVVRIRRMGRPPGLATILVGDDQTSAGYVRMKQERAEDLGFVSAHVNLPETATQADLVAVIERLNSDDGIDGMLVQHPTPAHIDYGQALLAVDPTKDVDGLHPCNLGRLAAGLPGPVACTPAGIEALLNHYGIEVAGKEVVILGRGVTVGRPLSILLSLKRPGGDGAVTLLHTGVSDWSRYTQRADILVAAVGRPGIVRSEHVKPGAVVIGAGVRYSGHTLLADVADSVADVAGWMTPRVGGVGPTTVAMLFRNAVDCAERRRVETYETR